MTLLHRCDAHLTHLSQRVPCPSLCQLEYLSGVPCLQDLTGSVGGEVANLFRQANIEAFMTQHVTGKGPRKMMDQVELQHWMNQACMVVQAAATAGLRSCVDQLAAGGLEQPVTNSYAVCCFSTDDLHASQ